MSYYVTTTEYAGPNTLDSRGAIIVREPVATISTEAPRTNQSGQVRTQGWLGTTNDWSESAHGEFETLEAARAYCAEQGWTETVAREEDDYSDEGDIEQWQSPIAAAAHWQSDDWFSSVRAADLGITAATTDEELRQMSEIEDDNALADTSYNQHGVILHGTLETLTAMRDELREEALVAA